MDSKHELRRQAITRNAAPASSVLLTASISPEHEVALRDFSPFAVQRSTPIDTYLSCSSLAEPLLASQSNSTEIDFNKVDHRSTAEKCSTEIHIESPAESNEQHVGPDHHCARSSVASLDVPTASVDTLRRDRGSSESLSSQKGRRKCIVANLVQLDKFLSGYKRFHGAYFARNSALYNTLRLGQTPKTVLIGCCDSRFECLM